MITKKLFNKLLGFKLDWKHQYEENMPFYFQISLNEDVIHLSEHHGDSTPGSAIRIKIDEGLEGIIFHYQKKDIYTLDWQSRKYHGVLLR